MSFYTIIPGPTSSGGSGFPLASDVNQFAKAFSGVEDVGTLTLASPTPDPTTAPTCAASAGSSLGVGTYVYAFTRVVGHVRDSAAMVVTGETLPSPTTSVTTTSGNQSVQLTLPTSPGAPVIGRRVYRTTVGGSQLKLVATIPATATSYIDNVADASLGADAPTSNSTGTTISQVNTLVANAVGRGWIAGLSVTATTPASMSVNVAAGNGYLANGKYYAVGATTLTAPTFTDAGKTRWDLVYINTYGSIKYAVGTPGINGTTLVEPSPADADHVIARVTVSSGATTVGTIVDRRVFRPAFAPQQSHITMFHAGTGAFTTTSTTGALVDGSQMMWDMYVSPRATVYAEFLAKNPTGGAAVHLEITDTAQTVVYATVDAVGYTTYDSPIRVKFSSVPPSGTALIVRASATAGTTSVKAAKIVVMYG